MDLNDIKNEIKKMDLNIYFCLKMNSDGNYICFSTNLGINANGKIREIIYDVLEKNKGIIQEEYNPAGSLSDTIEICQTGDYENIGKLVSSLNEAGITNDLLLEKISFIVYEFTSENEKIYFLRRYTKIRALKKGFIGKLINNNTFERLKTENSLGIDNNIDVIIKGEDILIINHTSFERIFNLNSEFLKIAEDVLNNEKLKKI